MTARGHRAEGKLALYGGEPARPTPIKTVVAVSEKARKRVMELLHNGELSNYYNGPWAHRLEAAYARFHSPAHAAVAVNSGTSALHLAVTAAGIGPGDEVLIPALCFVAAATAVVQNGGVPVICDAEPDSLTMDPERAEHLITSRTKAILAVHFWGYPANSAAFQSLCNRHGLTYIEDCAQALGAEVDGGKVGVFGTYATCAFSVRKHVACGEGGMVLCRAERRDHIRALSNYGKGPGWDDYECLGYSYRLAEIPAIVALDGLGRIQEEIAARQQAGTLYAESFQGSGLQVVAEPAWGRSVFFKCPVLLPAGKEAERQKIIDAISAENVSCRAPHRPLFTIPWLTDYLKAAGAYRGADDCPVVVEHYPRLIEIESGPFLPLPEAWVTSNAVLKVWRYFS